MIAPRSLAAVQVMALSRMDRAGGQSANGAPVPMVSNGSEWVAEGDPTALRDPCLTAGAPSRLSRRSAAEQAARQPHGKTGAGDLSLPCLTGHAGIGAKGGSGDGPVPPRSVVHLLQSARDRRNARPCSRTGNSWEVRASRRTAGPRDQNRPDGRVPRVS